LITLRLLARTMDEQERKVVHDSLAEFQAIYQSRPKEAEKLIRNGEKPPAKEIAATELAAWTMVTSKILNLDETITR
jgi:hypothetical protein